jgi:hypothetical protein
LQWMGDMISEGALADLELFLVGLIMAGTLYCDGPQLEDPTDNFELWHKSWDMIKPMWDRGASARGWCVVGSVWEYHLTC